MCRDPLSPLDSRMTEHIILFLDNILRTGTLCPYRILHACSYLLIFKKKLVKGKIARLAEQ